MRTLSKLLLSLLVMTSNVVIAQDVSVEEAQSRALDYLSNQAIGAHRAKGTQPIQLSLAYTSRSEDQTCFYVFNVGNNNGFIIASGDEVAREILGYCDHGNFDPDNLPSNLKAWLDSYTEEIVRAKASIADNETKAVRLAPASTNEERITVGPLVPTEWDQEYPYNYQCYFDGKECVTGCVATAMAQIMYYWAVVGIEGETFPCGSKPLHTYNTTSKGYFVDAVDQLVSFDWNSMLKDGSPEWRDAVAQLMRYCGQSIEMDYDYGGSAAFEVDAITSLIQYFGYNSNISSVNSAEMTAEAFDELVYNQMKNKQPVMMSAGTKTGYGYAAHEFICDGYDAEKNQYHFNWGWNGRYNGWYSMTSLTPNTYDFSSHKGAIIDIMPLGQPLGVKEYATLSPDESTLTFYNDNLYDTREGTVYVINYGSQNQNWWEATDSFQGWYANQNITDVVFDESFKNARPNSTSHWFQELSQLTNIYNWENLNTSNVSDMSCMFMNCNNLSSVNIGYFNTSKVRSMAYMFGYCGNLQYIDESREIWTDEEQEYLLSERLTNMQGMFAGCSNLSYAPLWDFANLVVTDMSHMFEYCIALDFDFSGLGNLFYTPSVTDMSYMFAYTFPENSYRNSLDLTSFDVSNVTDMTEMFSGCYGLQTIYCNDDWSTTSQVTEETSSAMFYDCYNLTGGTGFAYDENIDGIALANPSKYFTMKSTDNLTVLYDRENNAEAISLYQNPSWSKNVALYGRTLYKNGSWNTLCLPFAMTAEQVAQQLSPDKLMTLASSDYNPSSGTLSMEFEEVTSIKAGKPYIIKWQRPDDYEGNEETYDIQNPRFNEIKLLDVEVTEHMASTEYVNFQGEFSPVSFTGSETDVLYLGSNNTLYYPSVPVTINSFRGYFTLQNGLSTRASGPSSIRAFHLNFGDEENGIKTISESSDHSKFSDSYFSLDGRRLLSQPVTPGLYIINGKKVVIK